MLLQAIQLFYELHWIQLEEHEVQVPNTPFEKVKAGQLVTHVNEEVRYVADLQAVHWVLDPVQVLQLESQDWQTPLKA